MTTPVNPETVVKNAIDAMTPAQFEAYDRALRQTDYTTLSTPDLENFTLALRAANSRRQRESRGLNVTIREAGGIAIPWIPLAATLVVLVLAARL